MNAPRLRIILVKTLYDSNIGATSRAMANMGVTELILISPQCEVGESAQKAAATGQDALRERREFSDWEQFNRAEPPGLRLAFTARDGRGRDVRDFQTTLVELTKDRDFPSIDLVFGPENWGLANEDLDQCHYAVSIPTFGPNPSLNLAQATLLALFVARTSLGSATGPRKGNSIDEQPGYLPESLLRSWVETLGFDVDDRRINVHSVVRRLFLHSVPTRQESSALQVILQQSVRKMREYRQMRMLLGLAKDGESGRPLSDLVETTAAEPAPRSPGAPADKDSGGVFTD